MNPSKPLESLASLTRWPQKFLFINTLISRVIKILQNFLNLEMTKELDV